MRKKSAAQCACRALDVRAETSRKGRRPLVILSSGKDLKAVRDMVSVSMPSDAECFGSVWKHPDGSLVVVKPYSEGATAYPQGFDLEVCNGGRTYSEGERLDVERWRTQPQED